MPPATPLPAATVILLRDAAQSPEVLMIERHSRSEFMPDVYVFPGGRVDDADLALGERTAGITHAAARAALPTIPPELALGFFVAAVRETFEEAGVLLARVPGSSELLPPEQVAALGKHRLDVQSGRLSFSELILGEGLELATNTFDVHAHWITPENNPKRFDTIFFSTLAPVGQLAAHDGFESTGHIWIRPEDALDQGRSGKRQMVFPTSCNLETLCGFGTARDALDASRRRPVVAVMPRIEIEDGKRILVIPEEAGYGVRREVVRGGIA